MSDTTGPNPAESTDGTEWEGIPYPRAMAWTRAFFDFAPRFPGATFMNFIYRAYRGGQPAGVQDWVLMARTGENLGMTPDQYYTLRLTLCVVSPERYERHPKNHRYKGRDGWVQTPFDLND
jgi:hypothetical protein